MRIAIVSPYATVVPHFDTELEIAQQHLDQGDEVRFFNCLGGLSNCDFNPVRDPDRCQACIGRRQMGLELLQPNVVSEELVEHKTRSMRLPPLGRRRPSSDSAELKVQFKTLQELQDYQIDGFEIGYAALSSLVSLTRDPQPDLAQHQHLLQRLLSAALQTYRQTLTLIDNFAPDRIYVFNGRFAAMRAVFRAARQRGIDCYLHERGCDNHHFSISKNHLPHDLVATQDLIRQHWQDGEQNTERQTLAEIWYRERVQRVERNWHSFVKHQQRGTLPVDWNPDQKNIAVFCSSDDEFAAIGDCWQNPLYPDQSEAIARLAFDLRTHSEIHLTLRMHPNLAGVTYPGVQSMRALNLPNLTVLTPEATVDSYELVKASDCVVSFGSTIGIEAVYWERPSVLLGPAFYRDLGGTYHSESHEQTLSLLTSKLSPQSKTGALMYGYWLQTFGEPYQYFRASGLFDGTFKDQVLYARPPKKTLFSRIKSEFNQAKQRFVRG